MITFYAVYILSIDGRPLFGDLFRTQDSLPANIISTGLLEAMNRVHQDLSIATDRIDHLDTQEEITYFMKKYGDISVFIASNILDSPYNIADTIAWKFLRKYGSTNFLDESDVKIPSEEISTFIQEIMEEHSEIKLVMSRQKGKILTPIAIFDLPPAIQDTAISMLTFNRASPQEIADDLAIDVELALQNLKKLEQMGYLYHFNEKNQVLFQISN